ncbi:MAG: hypothetical protein KME30_26765 [Iphinoe sp. HA4291-MV1]|nr:hypothetical protein [Iphinoe sp. HA4291-MV1]
MRKMIQNKLEMKFEYLYEMLQSIKQYPGMYLGKSSITCLKSFLDGYTAARQDLGLSLTEQERQFEKFQEWIQERFEMKSSHGWDSIILFYSADEKDALNNFFELFERFCNGEKAARG